MQQKTSQIELQATIDALDAMGGHRLRAAASLGMGRGAFDHRIRQAALLGIKPKPKQLPQAQNVRATSTLMDADGNVMLQWIKASNDIGRDQLADWVKDAFADTTPLGKLPAPSGKLAKDLLTVYPIGDHHVAMYSWREETGADYDIKIAERLLVSAAQHLVDLAPASETGLIVNLGDFFHVDNLRNETTRSGNSLDVDTRYAAMIRAGVRMMRTIIECALTKHCVVRVVNAVGNHDDLGGLWLALALEQFYEKNQRVQIDTSPAKFYYHRHGKVLLGVTHGDTGKPERLAPVMAADRPQDWGETQHRYWLTGHVHTKRVIEFPGVMWETFRTLAPADAWAAGAGYRSGRDMTSIVFHAKHGELARHRFDVSMLA